MTSDYLRQHFPSVENGIVSTRRQFLEKTGMGMGLLGLAGLLPASRLAAEEAAAFKPDVPLHYPAKAKHVIQIFLNGEKRVDYTDEGKEFTPEGFFALQVHSGKSCKVRWRNLRIQEL